MRSFGWVFTLAMLGCLCWQCGAAVEDTTPIVETPTTAESPNFSIQVEGLGASKIALVAIFNDKQFIVDEVASDANGLAVFKKEEPYRQGLFFVLMPNNSNFQIIIAEDQTFSIKTKLDDLIGSLQIEGSIDNTLFYENKAYEAEYKKNYTPLSAQIKELSPSDSRYAALDAQRTKLSTERRERLNKIFEANPTSFFTKFKKAGQNPTLRRDLPEEKQIPQYRRDFWTGVDFSDDRLMNTPVIHNKIKRYFEELTPQQPDSIISALDHLVNQMPNISNSEIYKYCINWVALKYEPTKTTLMDSEAVFVNVVNKYITYDRAFWADSTEVYALQLRASQMANSLLGQAGPNVKVPNEHGDIKAVYDLEAPYIVVYLYNPDCEHCQEQTPVLASLHNKWQSEASPLIDAYAIAIDTEKQLWTDYITKTGLNCTNVFDPTNNSIYKTYYVDITPEVYILGPDRKIIAKNINVSQIEEAVQLDQSKR